ncbi:sulfocyanin-like copper-binding protein [Mycolicibacterium sp. HS_4_1]
MATGRAHRAWSVLAIAAASLILGLAATAVAYPGRWRQYPSAPTCSVPALPGTVTQVNLTDMGPMMGPWGRSMMGRYPMMGQHMMPGMGMMRIMVYPNLIPAGQISLRVDNTGTVAHEMVVLPLPAGQLPGQRVSGADGRVDEAGSLGEASRTCGADQGEENSPEYGIAPQSTGWTTLTLSPGRYELICNIAGHYAAGMYAELDVVAP